MAVSTMHVMEASPMPGSLFVEGFRLMRERIAVYLALAAVCGATAWFVLPHLDLYGILANRPMELVTTPPVSVVLMFSLLGIFFILPSALRRLEPTFKMTAVRAVMTLATLLSVGLVTDVGYAVAFVPGIILAVLLSQALIGALLQTREGTGFKEAAKAIARSYRGSVEMTKSHFATTLGVIAASLLILLVPFTFVLTFLVYLGVQIPPSLVVMTPLLFLTFIYFECVRYALIVRWYHHLAEDRLTASP